MNYFEKYPKTIILLIIVIFLIFIYNYNESFNETSSPDIVCADIKEGECTSKLCPEHCKITHTDSDPNVCYCVQRK